MGPEELGSVYESLLELVPDPDPHARTFGFINADADGDTKGNARKTTGSYYTPDSLVQELIKSALDPVIEARVTSQPDRPTEALLGITVVDPACGSGHFLLAAARRLAERLAALRAPEGAVRAQDYRHALREVITHCVYGVDRNPMALELARFALWLEGFEEGRPLGFLDHHLVCGDALIGITDVGQLAHGIPDAAFKPLSGDDKTVCKALARENKGGLKAFAKRNADANLPLALERDSLLAERAALEAMPDDTLEQQAAKDAAWQRYAAQARASRLQQAADLFVGAFLSPKAAPQDVEHTPTSQNLYLALFTDQAPEALVQAKQADRLAQATQRARDARVLHWPLAFVQVFQKGGFDCVLGNPPWERIKLQEEEFFATENRLVAQAKNKAERAQRIEWLGQGMLARHLYPELEHAPDEAAKEKETYARFIAARRIAEAASVFAHLKADEGGRYPLTGVGDVNTYALFAETIYRVIGQHGRAGFIVPTGIATDASTQAYFREITQKRRLVSLFDFDNSERVFPAVATLVRFSLVVLGFAEQATFAFLIRAVPELADERRRFSLTPTEFLQLNPNTLTCPVFRSRRDAELTKKIYARVPILIRRSSDGLSEVNPWDVQFMSMFHMSNDSHLFVVGTDLPSNTRTAVGHSALSSSFDGYVPLYEAKMMTIFDHRFGSYPPGLVDDTRALPRLSLGEYSDPAFEVRPRFYLDVAEVRKRVPDCRDSWFVCFRSMSNHSNVRRFIAGAIPYAAVGNSLTIVRMDNAIDAKRAACLLSNLSALVLDAIARWKVSGANLNLFLVEQFPVLTPSSYSDADTGFIIKRVIQLVFTADSLKGFAERLGYDGPPFPFDPDRRARLRAELDAYYARLYGLTREDLCYILDPASVMGEDYPSETFRVLKQNEEREFGEYRTQRLVLEAWDGLERGELT
jgi:SAM-dependent methyltransferase